MNRFIILSIIVSVCLIACGCAASSEDSAIQASAYANTEETSSPVREKEDSSQPAAEAESEIENDKAEGDNTEQADADDRAAKGGKAIPSKNGKLSVSGTALIDESGNEVQLKGISTHGISWFPEYINKECFNQLSEDFGANVIRLAMYTAESGGYTTDGNKEELKQLVKDGVNYAKEADMYAIIDWHTLSDNDPNAALEEAILFFDEMSKEFADYENVIYEICNEPNNGTTWEQIKEYAEKVIPVIRANDKEAVILTGTPNWCQYIDEAAADPLNFENVMHTVHYYAATHKEDLREKVKEAHESGLPIFISEYGICDASGNGNIDYGQAALWADLQDELNLSSAMWNLSNKDETSAIISPDIDKTSGFTNEDLSPAGLWIKAFLSGEVMDGEDENSDIQSENAGEEQRGAQKLSSEKSSLNVTIEVVNSWEENGKNIAQYRLEINNAGEQTDGWRVTLEFDGDFAYKDGWNANYSASGTALTVTNADYNGIIKSGETLTDIGFIAAGDGKIINAS